GTAIGDGNTISQNGSFPGTPNTFFGLNQFHGIRLTRRSDGQFNNLLIARNTLSLNGNDATGAIANFSNGIYMEASGVDRLAQPNQQADTINITQNEISRNLGDGIEFHLIGDADVAVDILGNNITENGRHVNAAGNLVVANDAANGIQVTENAIYSDSRSIVGTWQQNNISGQTNDGIALDGNFGDIPTGTRLLIGSANLNPVGSYDPLGNNISDNDGDGIQVTQGGLLTIGNNLIDRNGTLLAGDFVNAGVNIDGPSDSLGGLIAVFPTPIYNQPFQDILVVSNQIAENVGDGIEWLNDGGRDEILFTSNAKLVAQNNNILRNQGRGVDLLIRPGDNNLTDDTEDTDPASTAVTQGVLLGIINGDVSLLDNNISQNGQEGIYVVATNASAQGQRENSQTTLIQTGTIDSVYQLRLDIHGNTVVGNGQNVVNFPATGLVVRVGTTGGGVNSIGYAGGFATDGVNPEDLNGDGILDNDLNGDGYLNAANLQSTFGGLLPVGGISASITNNYFNGNFGDDILFHSYTSTVNPAGTAGNAGTFTVTNYDTDPLARLDLIFTDNTFGSIAANNIDRPITPDNEVGAFYNNGEGNFKSRTANTFFNNAARRRNATRLASNYSTNVPIDTAALNPAFLFPGMGDSTFRVIGGLNQFVDPALGVVTLDQIFTLDDPAGDPLGNLTIVDEQFEAMGVPFSGGNQFRGELPFGWGIIQQGRTGETNP
ncbi:MAG: hypothetical protein KDA58_12195, partial [Planctomycetaceae bacterium]|nr:hypothetical protein [Planctomycetaceae bacterium]